MSASLEQERTAECKVLNKRITIRELYSAEGGGSCQVDWVCVEKTCSDSDACSAIPGVNECLLYES